MVNVSQCKTLKKVGKFDFRYVLILFFFNPSPLKAQDQNSFTQFYINPSLLNPSFTGSDGKLALFLAYRKQWAGLEGSPAITNFNLQAPLQNKVNVGLNLSNNKAGLVSNSAILFTGGYTLALSSGNFVRFGISAGAVSGKVDIDALNFGTTLPTDPVLANVVKSNIKLIGNAGVSFHTKSFHIGLALPNIFQPAYLNPDPFTVTQVRPFESITFHASNRFYLAKSKNVFEPYLLYRLNQSVPSQIEAAGVFHIQNKVWVGASYKQEMGISALAGLKLNKLAVLGYSYTLKSTGANELNRPSHEIHFGMLFGSHKKNTPVYSFVDTEKERVKKKTPAELAAEKKKKEQALAKNYDKVKKEMEKPVGKQEVQTVKEVPVVVMAAKKKDSVIQIHNGGPRKKAEVDLLAMTDKEQQEDEAERLKRLEVHAENPTEHHGLENDVHPHAERHEFVKRGEHKNEISAGDYIVVGVFSSEVNAKKFDEGILKLGLNKTDYGFLTVKRLWYVYLESTNDIDKARQDRDKFRKMKMFKDAWLLTVLE